MNYQNAITTMQSVTNESLPHTTVHFVSPVLSCICAALSQRGACKNPIHFHGESAGYAQANGLASLLEGNYPPEDRSGQQGITYSRLTRLLESHEVDAGNHVVADLLYEQFDDSRFTNMLVGVVGELHDNVVSHAAGAGYSCAQTYKKRNGQRQVEFAVADLGIGMLSNVKKIVPNTKSDLEAIKWCLKKGNTTARGIDEWAQRLPDDSMDSPIPGPVFRAGTENHHVGLGLYQLRQLVRLFQGKLWIWSGETQILIQGGNMNVLGNPAGNWEGVVVELEVTVPSQSNPGEPGTLSAELEALAKSLGIQ